MDYKKIACVCDKSDKATEVRQDLSNRYDFVKDPSDADVIIALGGDGFMLHTIHKHLELGIPIYGVNCGSVGFLLNEYRPDNLFETLYNAKAETLHPLLMQATDMQGKTHEALAINEVSLLRETRQTAQLEINIDGQTRMQELVCDGILVSTPAGSSAYNLSVGGPILPIGSDILTITPISPFRPRRWKGALLPNRAVVKVNVLNPKKRPVSAVADFTEIRDVATVEIKEYRDHKITLLFDRGHCLEERIIREQFN